MKQLERSAPRRRGPPSASAWRMAQSPVGRVRMPHPSRFCGCLRINHVKNPFLLLVCVLLAAASLGQTSETAKAKPPVATVDGQTTSRSSGRSQTACHRASNCARIRPGHLCPVSTRRKADRGTPRTFPAPRPARGLSRNLGLGIKQIDFRTLSVRTLLGTMEMRTVCGICRDAQCREHEAGQSV
jgi:hypothetical protein